MNKRVSFVIDPELRERLRLMQERTGLSDSEQIRQAIRMWLDSMNWPERPTRRPHVKGRE